MSESDLNAPSGKKDAEVGQKGSTGIDISALDRGLKKRKKKKKRD